MISARFTVEWPPNFGIKSSADLKAPRCVDGWLGSIRRSYQDGREIRPGCFGCKKGAHVNKNDLVAHVSAQAGVSRADATKAVALDFDLTTTPTAAPPEFTEGLPQSLRVSQNAYAPQSSGVNGGYGKPIGTLDSLLRWDEATQTFKPISQQLTLNCTKGTISALGRAAVQIQCDDGRYSAVAVDGKTSYGPGGAFADLRTGESVGIGVAPSSLAPADPLNALPVATAVLRER